jgi:hypothetical protein
VKINITKEAEEMRKIFTVVSILIFILAFAYLGFAQKVGAEKPCDKDKPGLINVDIVKLKAVVVDIDKNSRLITLKGPKGNLFTTKAGEEVRNFDQIEKGDEVNISYFESVAIQVGKRTTEKPQESLMDLVEVAPKGAKPAGTILRVQELTADVKEIDYKQRTITLKGPEGNVSTFKVDPSVKDFEKVKKGDEINIRHTETLTISVDKSET